MCVSDTGPLYDKKRNLLTSDKLIGSWKKRVTYTYIYENNKIKYFNYYVMIIFGGVGTLTEDLA